MRAALPAVATIVLLASCGGGAPVAQTEAPSSFVVERTAPHKQEARPEGRYTTARVLRRTTLRVIATERKNGRSAWIRAGAVRLGATDVSIKVDRSARRLVLRRGHHVLRRMPIAVGRPGNETPLGRFAVTDLLRTGRTDSPYGCCALALSGHQTKLVPGWPGGDRLAIHGTPDAETVGTEASLGCMRAYTRDIKALLRRVPLGAPVFIRA
jgi:lipoprotein-anchoring transpeptidase ErfK/SrfK